MKSVLDVLSGQHLLITSSVKWWAICSNKYRVPQACMFTTWIQELTQCRRVKWSPFCRRQFEIHILFEIFSIWMQILTKFVRNSTIHNTPALVQTTVWYRKGDKPLSEPVLQCKLLMCNRTDPIDQYMLICFITLTNIWRLGSKKVIELEWL